MAGPALFCPICHKPVSGADAEFPFCSPRCRVIDLGRWATGDYRISSPVLDPDLAEELEQLPARKDD